ncbi:glutathione peroxidase [Shewanella indica]|uniref:glutathione peroxidase n=1 Tax=Shewanella indica TaxID=768528 RepID=UPI00313E40F3
MLKTFKSLVRLNLILPTLKGLALTGLAFTAWVLAPTVAVAGQCPDYLNIKLRKLHSKESVDLCELTQGKPVLLVNTASNCGFTPQFKALEALHKDYRERGLVVIGFPSDDFFQEENQEKDTAKVCYINYGVTFTMVATSAVRGSDVNPVFAYLGQQAGAPKWNFYKYLVSGDGKQVQSFNSRVKPDSDELIKAIESVL